MFHISLGHFEIFWNRFHSTFPSLRVLGCTSKFCIQVLFISFYRSDVYPRYVHNIIYMTWIYLEGYNMLQYVAQWFPIYWVASPPNESWINWDFFFTAQFGKYVPFSTFDAKKKPIVLSVSWFGERIHHLESPSPSQHASKIPQNQHRFSGRGCDEMMKCQTTLRLSVSSF